MDNQIKWIVLAWAWWILAAVLLAWHIASTRYQHINVMEYCRDTVTGRLSLPGDISPITR